MSSMATLLPGKSTPEPIVYEAGCALEPVWTRQKKELLTLAGNRIPIPRSPACSQGTEMTIATTQ
jgi:hypothetical protein